MTKARDIADGVDTADIADGAISTAKLADNSINATKIDVSGNGTSGQMLTSDGDGSMSWADAPSGFSLVTLSGSTPTIDWSAGTAFAQTLTADTTYTFSNVPSAGEIELFIKHIGYTDTLLPISPTPTGSFSGLGSEYRAQYLPQSICFNNDGTKLYAGFYNDSSGYGAVASVSLSTAYDVTTASYDGVKTGIGVRFYQHGHPYDISHDGSYLFSENEDTKNVARYNFGTADTVTTLATTASQTRSNGAFFTHSTIPRLSGLKFYDNGNKIIIFAKDTLASGNSGDSIRSFSLSSAYDLNSTLTLISSTCVTTAGASSLTSIRHASVSADGTVMTWTSGSVLYFGRMTTAFDITTLTLSDTENYSVFQVDSNGNSFYATTPNDDGSKVIFMEYFPTGSDPSDKNFYELATSTNYQLTLPTGVSSKLGSSWGSGADPATTSYVRIVTIDGGSNYFLFNQAEKT